MPEKIYEVKIDHDLTIKFDCSNTDIQSISTDEYNIDETLAYIGGMMAGAKKNTTDNEATLFFALRKRFILEILDRYIHRADKKNQEIYFDGSKQQELPYLNEDISIKNEFIKEAKFVEDVRAGNFRSFSDEKFETVVNIGINGFDLGGKLLECVFSNYKKFLSIKYISHFDPSSLISTLKEIKLNKTLFIVVSKHWDTKETIMNAEFIKQYLIENFPSSEIAKNFVTVSANEKDSKSFEAYTNFKIWNFLDERLTIWSAAAISIPICFGYDVYEEFLKGACVFDEIGCKGFKTKDITALPGFMIALLEVYYARKGYSKFIVPYSKHLENLPSYIQHVDMGINGKPNSNMILFGSSSPTLHHSIFQFIHQTGQKILTEFLLPLKPMEENISDFEADKSTHRNVETNINSIKIFTKNSHEFVVANCLGEYHTLWEGKKSSDPNKNCPGKKPSILITFNKVTPKALGALLAFYEMRTTMFGLLVENNFFDRFGENAAKDKINEISGILPNKNSTIKDDDLKEPITDYWKLN